MIQFFSARPDLIYANVFAWPGFLFYLHKLSEDAGPHAGKPSRTKMTDNHHILKMNVILNVHGGDVAENSQFQKIERIARKTFLVGAIL